MIELRPCGDCVACCEGHLIGNSYGNKFGNGKQCIFLVKQDCTIYTDRPETCRKYQCAWTQGLLPENLRPDQSGIMVSVEVDKEANKQFLKVIEMRSGIDYNTYKAVDDFCQANNTHYVKVPYERDHT